MEFYGPNGQERMWYSIDQIDRKGLWYCMYETDRKGCGILLTK